MCGNKALTARHGLGETVQTSEVRVWCRARSTTTVRVPTRTLVPHHRIDEFGAEEIYPLLHHCL